MDGVLVREEAALPGATEFLQRLRDRPDGHDIPVVVLTARNLTRDDRLRLGGANQILHKGDVSLRAVVERLHRLTAETEAVQSGQ